MQLLREDIRPSHIITREAIENAAASVAATGGSTNGVLHLLAIARELDIPFSIDEFDEIAARTPIVASLKPGGKFVATDIFDAGGVALVARELRKRDLVHAGARNVDGRTLGEIAEQVGRDARPARGRARSRRRSSPPAASPSCAATSRPTAASSSWPATSG